MNKKGRVGILMLEALTRLGETASTLGDLMVSIPMTPYGNGKDLRRRVVALRRARTQKEMEQRTWRAFQNLAYRLEREGFITSAGRGRARHLEITKEGKHFGALLRIRARTAPPRPSYVANPSDELTIISFDIPERERWKRRWLRSTLRHLDFTMLQQSLWVGTATLPREFLEDLRRYHLLPHVHIFAVSKAGSLHEPR